ncbi:hypothetical protein [Mycobacterium branderi]|uniref:Uncharacterized protein n=1 Tax=Mycobacterium branderi TaxID=43348 RepID=A0A7I7WC21_9MYCO|nr:hypothetical protein [Mycobacterium branderi]MCV7232417.1 hypothetical protein [Mycobacterium branderi]ORA36017.1 hypothetical protein BST20_15695 [Mycobacterium branderi]BBZ14442.1 hypothetical protein MBRA_46370 [Mycobacterium branderi]
MSSWAGSARRAVLGAIGAGAVSGAMLLGALPSAHATPAASGNPSDLNSVVAAGWHDTPMPEHWWHHHRWWHHWWWWW